MTNDEVESATLEGVDLGLQGFEPGLVLDDSGGGGAEHLFEKASDEVGALRFCFGPGLQACEFVLVGAGKWGLVLETVAARRGGGRCRACCNFCRQWRFARKEIAQ